jgi:hypothetical protein
MSLMQPRRKVDRCGKVNNTPQKVITYRDTLQMIWTGHKVTVNSEKIKWLYNIEVALEKYEKITQDTRNFRKD